MNAVGRGRFSVEQLLEIVGDGALRRFGGAGGKELDVGLGRQLANLEDGATATGCEEGQEH